MRSDGRRPRHAVAVRFFAILAILFSSRHSPVSVSAAPARPASVVSARFDIPSWLSAGTASRLDLGFDVLVPGDVPAPFGGEPAVDASDGFYSLYWLIPGAPPTYLLISGEAGGAIPDFSYYDRNVQLEINADVRGTPAYHDLTPIYDKVYWETGGIVYTVDSHNMEGTDSLSLANRLFPLGPVGGDTGGDDQSAEPAVNAPGNVQSGETTSIGVGGVANATITADAGVFTQSEDASLTRISDGSYEWQAPATDTDLTVTFTLTDLDSGDALASAETTVLGTGVSDQAATATISCPELATAARTTRISLTGSGTLTVDASDGTFPAESPNTDFAPAADGSDAMTGNLPADGAVSISWLAPEIEMTAYIFVYNQNGDSIAECGIGVTYEEIAVDVPEPTATPKPVHRGPPGDGTTLDGKFDAVVDQVLAFRGTPTGNAQTELAQNVPTPSPAATVKPKATAEPTATLAPQTSEDGMVAQTIGPEGGALNCPHGSGALLSIPAQALSEPSTVIIKPVPDTKMPTSSRVSWVSGTAFDITIASANGESVTKLLAPATLNITLPADAIKAGVTLYRVVGARFEPLDNVTIQGNTVSGQFTNFSRVVAGTTTQTVSGTTRDPTPFILAALGFVISLVVIFAIGTALVRRRPRAVTPRRVVHGRARIR